MIPYHFRTNGLYLDESSGLFLDDSNDMISVDQTTSGQEMYDPNSPTSNSGYEHTNGLIDDHPLLLYVEDNNVMDVGEFTDEEDAAENVIVQIQPPQWDFFG